MKHYLTRLEEAIKNNWDRPALGNFKGELFTFGELATQIEKFHIFFDAIGLKKGDKVALCAKNSARWGVTFFAANTYEAVLVPILADFHPDSVNSLVDHSGSTLLLTDTDIWNKLDITKMPSIKAVISSSDFSLLYAADESISKASEDIEVLFKEKHPEGFTAADVSFPVDNEKNLAIINYTSGTTSAPKGVMLRYECISANVEFGQTRIPSYPEDTIVSMLPMAHMYGMMFELIYPLCGGTSIYYLGKTPTPALLLGAMAEINHTALHPEVVPEGGGISFDGEDVGLLGGGLRLHRGVVGGEGPLVLLGGQREVVAALPGERGLARPIETDVVASRVDRAQQRSRLLGRSYKLRGVLLVSLPVAGIVRMHTRGVGETDRDGQVLLARDRSRKAVGIGIAGGRDGDLLTLGCERGADDTIHQVERLIDLGQLRRVQTLETDHTEV